MNMTTNITTTKGDILFEGVNSIVYFREEYQEIQSPIIIKVMREERPTNEQIQNFYNEYEITKDLPINGIRKIYKQEKLDGKPALVMQYLSGMAWNEFFDSRPLQIKEFLKIAIQTCQILGEIHQHNIIHKDINGRNIFITDENEVKIIDFGISTKINLKTQNLGNPEKLEGTLSYISPEQTGRMNRVVDYRTDLYSLGVTFYEVLAGRLPFISNDAMTLVHAHLAQSPDSPQKYNQKIPDTLAFIILKLMRKNAEDRYQSAFGLKYDLEQCLNALEEKNHIPNFELGKQDFSGKLQIPQKLYGRQAELGRLLDSFERTCQGATELMLISGYSGVGKSALVHEIHKPVTERRGYFIEGKFDQFQKNIPYSAWTQALKGFVNILLTENAQNLEKWKAKIMRAVGKNGQVLMEIIPDLEYIIGEQPELTELGGTEAQNRFNYVFQNFINTISRAEHPLVIFIDDWQWADSGSLNLLKLILTNCNEDYLFLLGAYRDNEVGHSHQFSMILDELKAEKIEVQNLEIGNLAKENLEELLTDTLHLPMAEICPLAELISEKTHGNAFFVTQMLKTLHEEQALFFDFEHKRWSWDLERIKSLNISDNVVTLMASKIKKLSANTQAVLELASCIGNRFDMLTLQLMHQRSGLAEVVAPQNAIQEALTDGLVIPLDQNYKFAHDRIQQAVYSLISEKRKAENHLKIGFLLVESVHEDEIEEYIFDIVNQINQGLSLITDVEKKKYIASLNLTAGKKSRDAGAYKPAFEYLETAISLLSEKSWETDYQTTLAIYACIVETAFLKGDFATSEQYINVLLENAQTTPDKMPAFEIMMQYHIAQGNQQKAIEVGLQVVELLNVTLVEELSEKLDPELLYNLPKMTNADIMSAMEIMDSVITPAWASDGVLFRKITYTMVDLSVKYGNCASSCVGYAFYGGLLCGDFGEIEIGYKFGKLATSLLDTFDAKFFRAKVDNLYISTVMHWKEPLRALRKPYFDAIQIGLETGELEFACYNIAESCHYHFLMGLDLDSLALKFEKDLDLIWQLKQEFHTHYLTPWQQMIANLLDYVPEPTHLSGEFFQENLHLENFEKDNQNMLAFVTYQAKSMLALYFWDIEKAFQFTQKTTSFKEGAIGMFHLPVFNFFDSIIRGLYFSEITDAESKTKLLSQITINQKELYNWAKTSPENHLHRYFLVQAEVMRLSGQVLQAMDYYDQAIKTAQKNKFAQDEALASELSARFYFQIGKEKIGKIYITDAHHLYQLWGAKAKWEHLERQFPNLFLSKSTAIASGTITNNTIMAGSGSSSGISLDKNSIIKASQTLSGEVVLENLLEKMMKIVIENAGAQKGLFILQRKGGWVIEAEAHIDQEEVLARQSIPIEQVDGLSDTPKLSSGVINYVIRTRETIVLGDASNERSMIGATYVQKVQPKSVLCMPLIYQGKLSGILYLENNLTTDAFTPDRLEILEMLSAQVTISIQNALLYENLEEKVKERTMEVMEQKEIIEKKNSDITSSINYAKRIQDATLPRLERVKQLLPDSFILFKPRDIVSGDFYWLTETEPAPIYEEVTQGEISQQILKGYTNEKIIVTVSDCTGHGVPGAFMSMTGMHLLNEIVELKGFTAPNLILEELHKGVRNALKQAESENRDGMDMALCSIDRKAGIVEISAAKNPVVYIQNGELTELKADKMPIGGLQKESYRAFTNNILKIKDDKGNPIPTMLYLFSDGYQDQFGGMDDRKFMIKHLKNLFFKIHLLPLQDQYRVLDETLKDWMQGHKQLDDIIVMGIRL